MECLYVCLFSNGHIKVGRSNDPQTRIAQHVDRVSCMGVTLAASSSYECGVSAMAAESALVAWCADLASGRYKNEWFAGLHYDDVCAQAERHAKSVQPEGVSIDESDPDFRSVLRLLKQRGYTQVDLASLCGVNQSSISDIASGSTKEPGYRLGASLLRIARAELDQLAEAR